MSYSVAACRGGKETVAPVSLWTPIADVPTILVTAGPTGHYTDDAGTALAGNGDTVKYSTNLADPTRPMLQPTGALAYTLVLDGGKWYLRKAGAGKFAYVLAPVALPQPFTVAMIFKAYAGGTGDKLLYRAGAGPCGGRFSEGGSPNTRFSVYGGSVIDGAAPYYKAACLRCDIYNGASSSIVSNDDVLTGDAGSLGLYDGATNLAIGADGAGGNAADLDLAVFAVYPFAFGAGHLANWRTLAGTYGVYP